MTMQSHTAAVSHHGSDGMMSRETHHALARGLGWFSIGLGMLELCAPRSLARGLGMPGSERLLQAYGLREIAAGVGILASRDPAPWMWGRVAGDALDVATLAAGLNEENPQAGNVALALAAVGGVTALDVLCAYGLSATSEDAQSFDYGDRSGFPKPASAMRGAARDFAIPRDMRTPEALRPFS
jgi:hypothetical protein